MFATSLLICHDCGYGRFYRLGTADSPRITTLKTEGVNRPKSSVGIVTTLRPGRSRVPFAAGTFFFSRGVKRSGREADQSPSSSAETVDQSQLMLCRETNPLCCRKLPRHHVLWTERRVPIVSPSTAALSSRQPAPTGTPHDCCGAQDSDRTGAEVPFGSKA